MIADNLFVGRLWQQGSESVYPRRIPEDAVYDLLLSELLHNGCESKFNKP